ncbi:MAG: thioesterase family protein [Gammaproteobacteria bacterium]
MRVTVDIKVRGFHLDVYQHVNNARFLEFLEEARWEYYENVLRPHVSAYDDYVFTVVNININYRAPALLGDSLQVDCQLIKLKRRSMILHQTIRNKQTNTIITYADVTFVLVDPTRQRAIAIEDPQRGELQALLVNAQLD